MNTLRLTFFTLALSLVAPACLPEAESDAPLDSPASGDERRADDTSSSVDAGSETAAPFPDTTSGPDSDLFDAETGKRDGGGTSDAGPPPMDVDERTDDGKSDTEPPPLDVGARDTGSTDTPPDDTSGADTDPCRGDLLYCDGECVDTNSEPDNCGRCGNTCGTGETCQAGNCESTSKVGAVVSETNLARSTQTDCGTEGVKSAAPAVVGNTELHAAAQAHADDMAMNNIFNHTGSDGSNFVTRINRTNFSGQPVAENIAAGHSGGGETVQQWVGSDGHCKNLMLQRATDIGVGVAYSPQSTYGWYWVQVFGTK